MKEVNGIKYIEKEKDWENIKRTDLVNVNGGLQEGYFFGVRFLDIGAYPVEKFPVIVRREKLSIVEDIIGEMPIIHDKKLSAEYDILNEFLTKGCGQK